MGRDCAFIFFIVLFPVKRHQEGREGLVHVTGFCFLSEEGFKKIEKLKMRRELRKGKKWLYRKS